MSLKLALGRPALRASLLSVPLLIASLFLAGGTASATPTPVGLGTATTFAIRAGTPNITDAGGASVITGDVGLAPAGGAAIGLTCSQVNAGAGPIYSVDGTGPPCPAAANNGLMVTVENDARASFNHLSGLPGATALANPDLAGQSLVSGIYSFGHGSTSNLGGTLTLDAAGDPNSVWIFQASSDLVTASASTIVFTNTAGASAAQLACNVFWTVQSSATLNTGSSFVGTILASASIFVRTGVTVNGRLLAANAAGAGGQVTLDHDTIIRPAGCATLPAGTGGGLAAAPAAPVAAPPNFTG